MKNLLKYLIVIIVVSATFSCNNEPKKPSKISPDKEATKPEAKYSIDTSGVIITWTAYKFTNKVGVSGHFNKFMLSPAKVSGSIDDILTASKLAVNTTSVNSNNEIRDKKLVASFFKTLHTDIIRGKILEAKQNKGSLELEMNSITNKIPYTYVLKNDTIFLNTTLNLKEWKGENAITELNKACNDLHTGEDGISKLWPDVSINIKLPVNKL